MCRLVIQPERPEGDSHVTVICAVGSVDRVAEMQMNAMGGRMLRLLLDCFIVCGEKCFIEVPELIVIGKTIQAEVRY